jgi:hypothetical protein
VILIGQARLPQVLTNLSNHIFWKNNVDENVFFALDSFLLMLEKHLSPSARLLVK